MAYLSVPKIFRHLTFLHLSSPFIVDNCSHISNLSFAITYYSNISGFKQQELYDNKLFLGLVEEFSAGFQTQKFFI